MKNREKYAEELLDIACTGKSIAIDKRTMQIRGCEGLLCEHCLLSDYDDCDMKLAEWAESEYIEQPKISKKDRAFIDYIRDVYNFVVRNKEDKLLLDGSKPWKTDDGVWVSISGNIYGLGCFDVKLPMVKREDKEPWTVGDLKNLEVCDEYEEA